MEGCIAATRPRSRLGRCHKLSTWRTRAGEADSVVMRCRPHRKGAAQARLVMIMIFCCMAGFRLRTSYNYAMCVRACLCLCARVKALAFLGLYCPCPRWLSMCPWSGCLGRSTGGCPLTGRVAAANQPPGRRSRSRQAFRSDHTACPGSQRIACQGPMENGRKEREGGRVLAWMDQGWSKTIPMLAIPS